MPRSLLLLAHSACASGETSLMPSLTQTTSACSNCDPSTSSSAFPKKVEPQVVRAGEMDHGQITLLQPRDRKQRKHHRLAPHFPRHPAVVSRHRSRFVNGDDDRPLAFRLVADQVVLHQAAFGKSEVEKVFEVGIGQQRDLARQQALDIRACGDRRNFVGWMFDARITLSMRFVLRPCSAACSRSSCSFAPICLSFVLASIAACIFCSSLCAACCASMHSRCADAAWSSKSTALELSGLPMRASALPISVCCSGDCHRTFLRKTRSSSVTASRPSVSA